MYKKFRNTIDKLQTLEIFKTWKSEKGKYLEHDAVTENNTIVNKVITRLKNDTWISTWILDGLEVEFLRKPCFYLYTAGNI